MLCGVAGLRGFVHQHAIESRIKRSVIRQLLDLLKAHRIAAVDAFWEFLLPQHRDFVDKIVTEMDCPVNRVIWRNVAGMVGICHRLRDR